MYRIASGSTVEAEEMVAAEFCNCYNIKTTLFLVYQKHSSVSNVIMLSIALQLYNKYMIMNSSLTCTYCK